MSDPTEFSKPDATATAYQLDGDTTTTTSHPNTSIVKGTKQGHSCCGGCCDMRRAVIVVNSIFFCVVLMGLLDTLSLRHEARYDLQHNITKYENNTSLEGAYEAMANINLPLLLFEGITKLVLANAGILGAIHFHIYGVAAAAGMYIISALYAFIVIALTGNIFGLGHLLLCGFFAYPHFYFIQEVRNGIMTHDNYYINEQQSCCCV